MLNKYFSEVFWAYYLISQTLMLVTIKIIIIILIITAVKVRIKDNLYKLLALLS